MQIAEKKSVRRMMAPFAVEISFDPSLIKAGDKVVTATLADNPTPRDFVSLLPLTVTLEDHAATEKIAYLPRKLSTAA